MHTVEGVVRNTLQAVLQRCSLEASVRYHKSRIAVKWTSAALFLVLCVVFFTSTRQTKKYDQSRQPLRSSARVASFNGKCLGGFITSDTESMLRQLSEHIFLRTSCDVLERLPARARSIAAAVRHKRRDVAREQV